MTAPKDAAGAIAAGLDVAGLIARADVVEAPPSLPPASQADVLAGIPTDARDRELLKLAGTLTRQLHDPALTERLLHAVNTTFCEPPLAAAQVTRHAQAVRQQDAGHADVLPFPVQDAIALPSYDRRMLSPGPLGDLVDLLTPTTQAAPAALYAHALAYFGAAAGPTAVLQHGNTRHPLAEFVLVVGATGYGRKGTAEADVRRVFQDVDRDWFKRCRRTGLASGEGLINRLAKEEDRRMLVGDPEFGGLLAKAGREGSTLSQTLRQAWDSEPLENMTKTDGSRVADYHLALWAHVTPEELRSMTHAADLASGFLNRFCFFAVERQHADTDLPELDAASRAGLIDDLQRGLDFARHTPVLSLSPDAADLWRVLVPMLEAPAPGLVGKLLNRGPAHVLRIAALSGAAARERAISRATLQAAAWTWAFCAESAFTVYGDRLGDFRQEMALQAIRDAGDDGIRMADLHRVFHNNLKAMDVHALVSKLEVAGVVRVARIPTAGRPVLHITATSHGASSVYFVIRSALSGLTATLQAAA